MSFVCSLGFRIYLDTYIYVTVFTDIPGYHEALGCKISLWQPSSISFLYVYFWLSYMGIHFTCYNATNVIKYTNIKLICLTFLIFHFFSFVTLDCHACG